MEMEHFLTGRIAVRLPDVQAVRRESLANGTSHAHERSGECGASLVVELVDVLDVSLRDNESMANLKLTDINERDRRVIFMDDARVEFAASDGAENTVVHVESIDAANCGDKASRRQETLCLGGS